MESIVTYSTYELINVFCFHFVYTILSLSHSEYNGTAVFNTCSRKPDFGVSDQVKFKPDCSSTSLGFVLVIACTTLYKQQKNVYADQITQRGSAITVHLNGHTAVIRLCGCPIFLFWCFTSLLVLSCCGQLVNKSETIISCTHTYLNIFAQF